MSRADLLLTLIEQAVRNPEQLEPKHRADLFEAIAMALDMVAELAELDELDELAPKVGQLPEQAREVAFQLREGDRNQTTLLKGLRALQAQPPREDGQRS